MTFLLTMTIGIVAVVTLTPSADGGAWGRSNVMRLDVTRVPLEDLVTVTERSLNVLLFVPLAFAAMMIRRRTARRWVMGAVWLSPIAIELTQYAMPSLGRSGFLLDDALLNLLGVAIGVTIALVVRAAGRTLRRMRRPAVPVARGGRRDTESRGGVDLHS